MTTREMTSDNVTFPTVGQTSVASTWQGTGHLKAGRCSSATTLMGASIDLFVVPPAYRNVWICPDPNGHIQATGRENKGRKQYRYHPRWSEVRDSTKYEHMLEFAKVLPVIRARQRHGQARTAARKGVCYGSQFPGLNPRVCVHFAILRCRANDRRINTTREGDRHRLRPAWPRGCKTGCFAVA
jgi:Bacterial DNA topoisomerase IB, N-terminal domain